MSSELKRLFPKKERRIGDLLEFVKTRTGQVPSYTLLLGAGASATSGIRTAAELISVWIKDLYQHSCREAVAAYSEEIARQYLSRHHTDWYLSQQEYASLFKRKFDLPRQRRMFVESEVVGKLPSMGYLYLIRLIEQRFFRTIFTLNFDDLLNEAFHQYSTLRPMICAHDSSVSSITVTSDCPKIVKLHGDYLFDDIKVTIRETEALGNNTRNKFAEFCKNQGQIVVGYSGRDRSIMDVLQDLARQDDYFRLGLYWCTRSGDVPSDELIDLLHRERVYWVEVEGFDELMAQLYQHCVGNEVPINAAATLEKPWELITRFCEDTTLRRSTCSIIRTHLAALRREREHERVVENTRAIVKDEVGEHCNAGSLSDREHIQLMPLKTDLHAGNYETILQKTARLLSESPRDAFREHLLAYRIRAEMSLGRLDDAMHTCDSLIEQNPGEVQHRLRRADMEPDAGKRLAMLSRAIEINPSSFSAFGRRAELRHRQLREDPACDVETTAQYVLADYQEAIELHPCIANRYWSPYFQFLLAPRVALENRRELMDQVLHRLRRMNPCSATYLELRIDHARRVEGADAVRQVLDEIRAAAVRTQPRGGDRPVRLLLLRALLALGFHEELLKEISACNTSEELRKHADYIELQAKVLAHAEGKLGAAIDLLRAHEKGANKASTARHLILYLGYAGFNAEAQTVLREYRQYLDADDLHDLEGHVCSLLGDYTGSLEHTRQRKRQSPFQGSQLVSETHALLKLKRFPEAEEISRPVIDAVNLGDFHEIMINHELARIGQDQRPNSIRLERVLASTDSNLVCLCAHLLNGDMDAAAARLLKAVEFDKCAARAMRNWAIFDIPKHAEWLQATLRDRSDPTAIRT